MRVPPKAIRDRLESEEDALGFEYFLADRLRMTVGQVRRMPSVEFQTWLVWHAIRAQRKQLQMEGG